MVCLCYAVSTAHRGVGATASEGIKEPVRLLLSALGYESFDCCGFNHVIPSLLLDNTCHAAFIPHHTPGICVSLICILAASNDRYPPKVPRASAFPNLFFTTATPSMSVVGSLSIVKITAGN